MNFSHIKMGLQQLLRTFKHFLDDNADGVITEAIAELEGSKKRFDELTRRTDDPRLVPNLWGYRIYPERPLRFKASEAIRGLPCWIDLYCTVLWREEEQLPIEQSIHLRLWSNRIDYIYRDEWDCEEVFNKLTEGRVMFRCHFDLANPQQQGPK